MGVVYYGLEVMFRGYSHWSMFLLGGICGILIGLINEHKFTWDAPLYKQILIGELIVIPLEFITGCIVNLWLGWNVWNYSNLPFNILGQVSLLFVFVFAPVILLCCALLTALFSLYGDDSYSKMQALRRSLAIQRQTNRELKGSIEKMRQQVHGIKNDPRALEKVARNELGLAHPSEVIFVFEKSD